MGRHSLLRAILAAALAFGAVLAIGATPAMAGTSASAQADLATSLRDRARKMALDDVFDEVKAEAWKALLSDRGDAAIREFFVNLPATRQRALTRIEDERKYVERINRFSIAGSAVRVSSQRALEGTHTARHAYVQSGYARAQEQDRANNNKYEERLARLAQEDRDYVTHLAANDPGVQVKAAAQRAIAGDDTSIGLFFKYYWGIGADLDDEGFRRRTIEQNEIWHDKIESLKQAALAAEQAERESSGELARKARQDAIAKWDEADRAAGQSSVDWSAEQGRADAQAAAWARVAEYARSAQSEQDWLAILEKANSGNASWADEAAWAQSQVTFWQILAADMRRNAEAARERDLGDR